MVWPDMNLPPQVFGGLHSTIMVVVAVTPRVTKTQGVILYKS